MNGFSEHVYRFLYHNMVSVEQLEVLLLLRRSPERGWPAEAVAQMLDPRP